MCVGFGVEVTHSGSGTPYVHKDVVEDGRNSDLKSDLVVGETKDLIPCGPADSSSCDTVSGRDRKVFTGDDDDDSRGPVFNSEGRLVGRVPD